MFRRQRILIQDIIYLLKSISIELILQLQPETWVESQKYLILKVMIFFLHHTFSWLNKLLSCTKVSESEIYWID